MARPGKKYRSSTEQVDKTRVCAPLEAVRLLKSLPSAKFDESVEVHFRLGVDPRQADQQVRGTVVLPHGTGKSVRVAVFAKGDKAREAEGAGADVVGAEDLVARVEKGEIGFDAAIATPDMMGAVGKIGKILGPRGLMPNPKAGTVTFDVKKAVLDIKAGKVEYRLDKQANMHVVIGKLSFEVSALVENYAALLEEVVRAKPPAAKGRYIRSITLTSTMGPGIPVDPSKTRNLLEEPAA